MTLSETADTSTPPAPKRRVGGPITRTKAVWRQRRVLGLLVRRDLKVRYAESVLGYFWTILDPLLLGGMFWFVFTVIFPRSIGDEPYIVFLLCGLLPFRWFRMTLTNGPGVIKNEGLVRSTALPREIWALRLVFGKGVEYILSLPVLAAFTIGYWHAVNWELVLMIPAIALQTVLLTGVTLFLSTVGAMARDVDRAMSIIGRLMRWASPVIYGLADVMANDHIPGFVKTIYIINPFTGIINLYRAGFFPGEIDPEAVVSSVVGTLVVFVVGWWAFIRLEPAVLKEV